MEKLEKIELRISSPSLSTNEFMTRGCVSMDLDWMVGKNNLAHSRTVVSIAIVVILE